MNSSYNKYIVNTIEAPNMLKVAIAALIIFFSSIPASSQEYTELVRIIFCDTPGKVADMLVKHSEEKDKNNLMMPIGCGIMTGLYFSIIKDVSSIEVEEKTMLITEVTLSFGRVYSYKPKKVMKH